MMGNKQSNQDSSTSSTNTVLSKKSKTSLVNSTDEISLFLKHLYKLPFSLTEEEFDLVNYDVERVVCDTDTYVLQEGEAATGLYYIIKGSCIVLANNGFNLISQLNAEEFFGEVSCIYKQSCTCSILTTDKTEMFFLSKDIIQKYIDNRPLAVLKDWYINQKYIDTSNIFAPTEISKPVIKYSMVKTHLFQSWSDDAVSFIYDKLAVDKIVLFPVNSLICSKDYKDECCYLLLKGAIEIYNDDQVITEVNTKENKCFLFGDEQLFLNQNRHVSIRAKSLCQLVLFEVDCFQHLSEYFPIESAKLMSLSHVWKESLHQRLNYVDKTFYGFMDIVTMTINLKKIPLFTEYPYAAIFFLVTNSELIILNKGDDLLLKKQIDINNSTDNIIVLHGRLKIINAKENESIINYLDTFNIGKEDSKILGAAENNVLAVVASQRLLEIESISNELTVIDI